MPPLPAGLILDAEEQMAFEQMGGRNTITFNRLGDNQSRLAYIQALVNTKNTEMERSEIEFQTISFVAYLAVLICLTVLKDRNENERSMGRNEIVRYDEWISRSIGLNRRNERLNERLNEQSVEWTGRLIFNERLLEWTDRSVGQNTNEWLNEPTLRDENDKKLNPKEELESFFTNWTNRVPKKSFSLIFISQNCSITTKVGG
ncbi:11602_t:CDS:2 [Funneliformis caledonium]|uniref:11602_t:CDS:1 n=1 Tax=Funneliformis caledonium TaxID=1117310 RepID=A0A9N8VW17_9GLOM|nr:11602_t:CDS:2 [Funneliformis caledonium]